VNGQDDNLTITSRMAAPHPLRKELSIGLTTSGSRVKLRHSITNEGSQPITLATWALTVMAPGGTEIIPQPPLGEHPRDLLPNRTIVLWPYTDLTDSRWKLGCAYFLLQQNKGGKPTKVGLAHDEKWVGYLLGDQIFIKTFDFQRDAAYPDGGCNFETFTNYDMLEIESLGPLATLHPGESTSHDETWHLEAAPPDIDPASEISLTESLRPIISKIL
jgi:hypothetical protein